MLTFDTRKIDIRWDHVFSTLRRMRAAHPAGTISHASRVLHSLYPPMDDEFVNKATTALKNDLPGQYRASLNITGGQFLSPQHEECDALLNHYQLLALPVAMYWWHQIGRVTRLNNPGQEEMVTDALLPIAMMSSYSQPASIHDVVQDFHVLGLHSSGHYGQVLSLDLDAAVPKISVIADSFEEYFEQRTELFLNRIKQ